MDAINFRRRAAPNKRKLTDRRVQKANQRHAAYLIWDTVQQGLALRVQPSGHKAWIFVYQHNRKPRWLTFPLVPVNAAREKAMEVALQVFKGQDPAAEKVNDRHGSHFSTIAHRYVEEHARLRNKSFRHSAKLVQRYLHTAWSERDITAITRADVRTLIGEIQAPTLANQVRKAASAIFTWAVSQDIVQQNPCRGITDHATTSRERVLSDAEIPLFMAAFRQAGDAGRALQLCLWTGARPGEVARMKHEHIVDGWWTQPGKPDGNGWKGTKNGVTHRVWLPEAVRELIGSGGANAPTDPNGSVGSGVPNGTGGSSQQKTGDTNVSVGSARRARNT